MNTTTNTDLSVANTILAQLGGNRFIAMTGARNLAGDHNSLQFKLGRGAKDGITNVRVTLEADDTYTVTFFRIRSLNVKLVKELSGVYCDQLREIFTATTGFYTSL